MITDATRQLTSVFVYSCILVFGSIAVGDDLVTLRGTLIDADSGGVIAGRLYIQDADGKFFHAKSGDPHGSAVEYNKQRSPTSVEIHTTLSAHQFVAQLPPGKYTLTAERGKEYRTATTMIDLQSDSAISLSLSRWIDMASLGWYSGETHVHRSMSELPNIVIAEDLNVALPLNHWVTRAYTPPGQGDKNSEGAGNELVEVDSTHVIYPLNTEYEIFSVDGKRHTLGAIFALNHKTALTKGVPPVRPIAERVHAEGGLLELDKHNWEWSMMLVPVMDVDLYELTNNHVWRTEFYFSNFGIPPAAYMSRSHGGNLVFDANGEPDALTEQGWLDFTFQNYYALLNCGFRLRPTAGTASGVHPVPLGFGRVYVHLPDGFSYDAWMQGLDVGRSFVTTGPMLAVTVNDGPVGATFEMESSANKEVKIRGWATSEHPLTRIEVVSSTGVTETIKPQNDKSTRSSFASEFDVTLTPSNSTWYAVRCYERLPNGRIRFAHTAPTHVEVIGKPLRPSKAEAAYLVERVQREIERNTGVLKDEAMDEFREALKVYKEIAASAR